MKLLLASIVLLFVGFGRAVGVQEPPPLELLGSPINSTETQQTEREARPLSVLAQAVQLAENEHHSAIKAELLSSMAIIYGQLGQKEESGELLARSRQLIEENDDLTTDCYECPSRNSFGLSWRSTTLYRDKGARLSKC